MRKQDRTELFVRRWRLAYWRAHLAEYAADRDWTLKANPHSTVVIPRPTALSGRLHSSRFLVWIVNMFSWVWPVVFPLIIWFRFLQAKSRNKRIAAKQDNRPPQRIVLATSGAIMRMLDRVEKTEDIPADIVVVNEWKGDPPPQPNARFHNVLDFLDDGDLSVARKASLQLGKMLSGKVPRSLRLQGYDTYSWVLLALYLDKTNPSELWSTNWRDRWAFPLDQHVAVRRQAGLPGRLVIIQHGISPNYMLKLPKLREVTDFWYFNEASRNFFERNLVIDAARIRWRPLKNSIPLTELERAGSGISVLIVSHKMYAPRLREIISAAGKRVPGATFYYKPHPLHPEDPMTQPGVVHVSDRTINPKVDVLVSYRSTYAVEYADIGIPCIYIEDADNDAVVDQLEAFAAGHRPAEPIFSGSS